MNTSVISHSLAFFHLYSCWVSDNTVFYVCVVGVVAVVLLVNGSVFLVVLLQVRRACVSEHSGVMKELRGVTSLTLLLGLTWSTAFLTWGDARVPLLYIFSILNSLQGEMAQRAGLSHSCDCIKVSF